MEVKITVLDGSARISQFKNEKTGNLGKKTSNFFAECIRYDIDEAGVERREVGVMKLPGALCPIPGDPENDIPPAVPAGDYLVEFKIRRDFQTREFLAAVAGVRVAPARPEFVDPANQSGPVGGAGSKAPVTAPVEKKAA